MTGALFVSVLLALLSTYAYGAFFAHDRYWMGTKRLVDRKDAKLIEGMLKTPQLRAALPRDARSLSGVFEPVNGLLAVELWHGNDEIFSNRELRYASGEELARVALGEDTPSDRTDDHTLIIHSYAPPTWSRQFWRWMRQPGRWLEPSFNVTTAPFAFLFSIILVGCLALGWRTRATHLEHEVLRHLRTGGRE
jgi:hypothetical protein